MGDETGVEGGGFGAAYEDDETADGRRADVLLSHTALLGLGDGKGRIVCRLGEWGCFLFGRLPGDVVHGTDFVLGTVNAGALRRVVDDIDEVGEIFGVDGG